MKSLLLIGALVLTTAYAETWTARGTGTDFTLNISQEVLKYQSPELKEEITLRDCNREQVGTFLDTFREQVRTPASVKNRGIIFQIDNQPVKLVDYDSRLGMQFSDMDDSIRRLKVMNHIACAN